MTRMDANDFAGLWVVGERLAANWAFVKILTQLGVFYVSWKSVLNRVCVD